MVQLATHYSLVEVSSMKPHFSELTLEEQATFGNGCTFVPDFHYTASCRHHDYQYLRGGGLYDKVRADWIMCRLMLNDSYKLWHYIVTVIYWLGLTFLPFSYVFFWWTKFWKGNYRTNEEILELDYLDKIGMVK